MLSTPIYKLQGYVFFTVAKIFSFHCYKICLRRVIVVNSMMLHELIFQNIQKVFFYMLVVIMQLNI